MYLYKVADTTFIYKVTLYMHTGALKPHSGHFVCYISYLQNYILLTKQAIFIHLECYVNNNEANMFIVLISSLKQLGRLAFLNHNIYTAAEPTPVDVDHAAHMAVTVSSCFPEP